MTDLDLAAALPDTTSTIRARGLGAPVEIWRDRQGIPHLRAESTRDAFLGQGFVHAQDRLWQMEYDRRRAYGRWAELAGPGALAQDIQMRRFRLEASARADYDAVNAETRAMLDAYAAGVNAFIETTRALPVEFGLVGARPEPWQPWDSGAVFKVRHVLMGLWQVKAWRARLVRQLGAARASALCPGTQANPMLILPPGVAYDGAPIEGLAELTAGEAALPALPEWEVGSNNWAVSGALTASGKPLVAGDPHRPLDVPSVYYQNHLAGPEFDAIGLSFAGVPGLPHFGHNARVAWCVTHAQADYQDLFIERFDAADPRRYQWGGQWLVAETAREVVVVRGAAPVDIDVTVTRHGPIVLGDPRRGTGIAFSYTATAGPNHTFESLLPMLRARTAAELDEAQRPWVDPANNLVFADVDGAIGYRTRGAIPVRPLANAWLPVPGWDGAHEWRGMVPFEEMPATRNPANGFIVTANSRIVGDEYRHYLAVDWTPDFRTRRLVHRLGELARRPSRATAADMAELHADRVSLPARAFVDILAARAAELASAQPAMADDAVAKDALARVLAWDGAMDSDQAAPTIYSAFRETLLRDLMEPILGPLTAEAFAGTPRGAVGHMSRLRAVLADMIRADDRRLLPPGGSWTAAMARAFAAAVAGLRAALGDDVAGWCWGRVHTTKPEHTLAATFPQHARALNPPAVAMGGDGDTVQAASFIASAGYTLTSTSVARYVFDLADWERSVWIVPLGASGHPGSPHHADQAEAWAACRHVPMRYDWAGIRGDAETHQTIQPAS